MKITAVAVGSRGDTAPFIELGRELIARGHDFRLAAFEDFHSLADTAGIPYIHLDGSAEYLTQVLVTEYVRPADFIPGCMKLYHSAPRAVDQMTEAIRGSDLVLYGMLAGLVRSACELYGIPAVRVFFSPFDATNQYSLYTNAENRWYVGLMALDQEPVMNYLTIRLHNSWRETHGLRRWRMTDDYRRQNGKWVPTLYPVSKAMMPPDPKWRPHIHVTGYWFHPEQDAGSYIPSEKLCSFLSGGEPPVFVCLGSMVSEQMHELQRRMLSALNALGVHAIVQLGLLSDEEKKKAGNNIFFTENVPYAWLFRHVRAVVHHGGCTTNGLGLYCAKPTLVIPMALDQYFYGRRVHDIGAGPEPLYIRKNIPTAEQLARSLKDLLSGRYDQGARAAAEIIREEDGCRTAADILLDMQADIDGRC